MIIRALSFISKKFEQQHIIKVMNKLEGLLYMQVPNASKNDIIEIIKNIARIFNGGGNLFWISMDQQINRRFDNHELSLRDLQTLIYMSRFRPGNQYYLK